MGPVNLILTDTQTALCCELQPSVTRTYLLSLKGTAAQKGGVREDQSLLIEPAKQPNDNKNHTEIREKAGAPSAVPGGREGAHRDSECREQPQVLLK